MKVKLFITFLFGYACAMVTTYLPPIGIMSGDVGVVMTTHDPVMIIYTWGVAMGLLLYAWISYEKEDDIDSNDISREDEEE